ncbi:stalk domain-containing protein [Cohnella caldifontis]|uniref:stalk domain-containing protein n=1 Tax=Cohnella caldifontis TaxID=3027471 RepID=UPI0023EE1C24|nr:stalk domain-containing protein [Cohnella sp. YIM B05605]
MKKRAFLVMAFAFVMVRPHGIAAAESFPPPAGWSEISAGSVHSLAIKQDGTVWEWGTGDNGTDHPRGSVPARVEGLTGAVQVAAGSSHSLALKQDGTVWAWGGNEGGQLGNGYETELENGSGRTLVDHDQSVPHQVEGVTDVVSIAADWNSSFAVRADGTVWAWGAFIGKRPVKLEAYANVASISMGYAGYIVLKKDGTVWAPAGRFALEQVEGLRDIVQIAVGAGNAHALDSDGTVWAWGINADGEIGDGTTEPRPKPVRLQTIRDVAAIASSAGGPLYLKKDGTVWTNGDNVGGQLGIGSYEDRKVPTPIPGLKKIKKIASSGIGFRALAIRQDNTLWAWGNGYVGDGTQWYRTTPVWIPGYASERLVKDPVTVEINGSPVDFDQQPAIVRDRVMVPLRKIFEVLEADMTWDPDTRTVQAAKGDRKISLTIGSPVAEVDGKPVPLEAPPVVLNSRTLVPARFIAESLGADVEWDSVAKTVKISMPS